ncbi:MAG: glycosyltransferase family 4 protein [Chloroflexota bacterium]
MHTLDGRVPRVVFVIYSLTAGGAERVLTTMANAWAGRGWNVTVLPLDDGVEPPFYDLAPAVHLRPLDLAARSSHVLQAICNNVRRAWRLRRAIGQCSPDVVIGIMDRTSVLTLLAMAGTGVPVVAYEHSDPAFQHIGRAWEVLRNRAYRRAAQVVVQTEKAKTFYPPAIRARTRVIPNPIAVSEDRATGAPDGESERHDKVVIAMGRLVPLKGFDLLVQAFARVSPAHPEWRLEIWGEGPDRAALETMFVDLNLTGRACLAGRTHEPFSKLRAADLFVLSSRSEGFSNVLCEAMACGLPVVSFDCPNGPRAIVRHGVDGLLVPPENVPALAHAMDTLMTDGSERHRLAQAGREVLLRFGVAPVMAQWDRLLEDLIL